MENEKNSMQLDVKSGLGLYHRLLFPKPSSLAQNFTRGRGPLAGLAQTRAQQPPQAASALIPATFRAGCSPDCSPCFAWPQILTPESSHGALGNRHRRGDTSSGSSSDFPHSEQLDIFTRGLRKQNPPSPLAAWGWGRSHLEMPREGRNSKPPLTSTDATGAGGEPTM